jgi:type II pantothenate kinase
VSKGAKPPAGSGAAAQAVGIDAGATLTKIAIEAAAENGRGPIEWRLRRSDELESIASEIRSLGAETIGLTGAGTRQLGDLLLREAPDDKVSSIEEFDAWQLGAGRLFERAGIERPDDCLLVSLGTGTSILRLGSEGVQRVGGTALGGGTVSGLGRVLAHTDDFGELCQLAHEGERGGVDLRVSDIYLDGDFSLSGDITAASFAKLARTSDHKPTPADCAAGIMGLVGENVAMICCGLAHASSVERVVYGGSTLRSNAALVGILKLVTLAMGRIPIMLPDGEFVGAVGALELAKDNGAG